MQQFNNKYLREKSQQACLGSNAFRLASHWPHNAPQLGIITNQKAISKRTIFGLVSHVVQGSSIFTGTTSVYCKCSSSGLPSTVSFDLQYCTGNFRRQYVNLNCVNSSVFFLRFHNSLMFRVILFRLFFHCLDMIKCLEMIKCLDMVK